MAAMTSVRSLLRRQLAASRLARSPMPTKAQFSAAMREVLPARAAPVPSAAGHLGARPMSTLPRALSRALTPSLTSSVSAGAQAPSPRDAMFAQRRLRRYARASQADLLRRAETQANAKPHDSHAQAEYLALLNEAGMEQEVVRRAQSGRFASGGRVHAEVERATTRLQSMGPAAGGGVAAPYGAYGAAPVPPPIPLQGTSSSNPVHVLMASKTTPLNVLAKLLSVGFTVFLCVLIYQSLKGKGGGMRGPLESLTGGFNEEQKEIPDVKLADVKGVEEAKEELEHIVDYLKNPEKYTRLGGKIPKGVLLTGPPGTGKTLLARAIAGEAEVPFFYRSASEFEEMLVGLGASRVRKLFEAAQEQAPCIVFIDEIDAIGGKRVKLSSAGMDRQTLNQLLSSMDGFVKNEGVIVLAATNFPQSLDGALTRPGRFDVTVTVPLPDVQGRAAILEHYFSKTTLEPGIDPMTFARATPGMSGAELEALVNQAALRAAKRGAPVVTREDLDEAKDKLTLGPARKSRVVRPETLRKTAYHEGGHTLVAMLTEHSMPIYKTTILPRGHTAGVTYFLPEYKDEGNLTRSQIMAQLDVAMGGRVAEEIIYGEDEVTTGAGSDMQKASQLARQFVMQFSMSKLGLSTYDRNFTPSPQTQAEIDREVSKLLKESYARASALLTANRKQLDLLAEALVQHETLTLEEMKLAVRGKKVPTVEQKAAAKAKAAKKEADRKAGKSRGILGLFGGGGGSAKKAEEPKAPKPPTQPPTEGPPNKEGGRKWV